MLDIVAQHVTVSTILLHQKCGKLNWSCFSITFPITECKRLPQCYEKTSEGGKSLSVENATAFCIR
jgi:hypothetical protein